MVRPTTASPMVMIGEAQEKEGFPGEQPVFRRLHVGICALQGKHQASSSSSRL